MNEPERTLVEAFAAACCEKDEISDVEFILGCAKEAIPAHRTVLAIRSPVFRAMLYGPYDEGKAGARILIPDIEPEEFRIVLRYAYTDQMELGNVSPIRVWYAANKYAFCKLATHCIEMAHTLIVSNNAAMLLSEALEVGEYEAAERFLIFIRRHAKPVFSSPCFEDISVPALTQILESDTMDIEEIDVFNACIRWAKAECARQKLNDITSLRSVMSPVLPLIRFPLLTIEQLGSVVQDSGVLNETEMLPLLLHVANPTRACGPFLKKKRVPPLPPRPRKLLILGSEAAESRLPEVVGHIRCDDLSVESCNTHHSVPATETMDQYGAVLVWSNNTFHDHDAISSLLSDYVFGGGGAVVATFALKAETGSGGLGGAFSDKHLPVERGKNLQHEHHQLGRVIVREHPIMEGVERFSGGTESHRNDIKPKKDAIVIAEWDDGVPFIVVSDRVDGSGRVVVLNFFPVPRPQSSSSWDPASSDGGILLRNSLLFAGHLV